MSGFRRIIAAFAILVAGTPLAAQDNGAQSAPPAETVGPRELENFSLEGRVTRPAEEPAQPAVQPPPPATEPRQQAPASSERPSVQSDSPAAAERGQPRTPAGELLSRPPTRPLPRAGPPAAQPAPQAPRPSLVTDAPAEGGSSLLMWVAALLFLGGAATVYWFLRQGRQGPLMAGGYRAGYATGQIADPQPVPTPAPLPRAAAPQPQPARAPLPTTLRPKPDAPVGSTPPGAGQPAQPVGIVASSLRPWIDVELTPDRALVDENGAAIAFNVTLVNSGSAPARDVSIEACLLNAGARQDAELSEFYTRPKKSADAIPVIAPMSRVPLRTAVKIPRDMIQEYEVEGRKLFMPMVAVSTRYRWSSGEGQTGASFLVGKGQEAQERLAPLRIDQGARSWQGLGARRYEKGLRR